MTVPENPNLAKARALTDPVQRARFAQEFITNGRSTLAAMQQVRDDAIRESHAAGRGTVDQIAADIGCKRNVVVDALRQRAKEERDA